jgi:hypothetical protein
MNKLLLLGSTILFLGVILYLAFRPKTVQLTVEGQRFSFNYCYASHEDIPLNWYPVSSYNYEAKGDFYFTVHEEIKNNSDSLSKKFTTVTHINDGYLKKITLIPKDGRHEKYLNINDSLIFISVAKEVATTKVTPKENISVYIYNEKGAYFEISIDTLK